LIRSFHHSDFPLELLLESKRETVTVVLPAREVAATIGPTVEALMGLRGLVDQVLVVDAGSADGSGDIAAGLGAEVHQEAELMPEFGPVLGKGDAMWRALSVVRGPLVAYLDSDTRAFSAHFATGMLGPLIRHPELQFVKAHFRRPFVAPDGQERPGDGGRVTELTARPLLSAFYPDLAALVQPLAGEVAARASFFGQLPFACGYAVETSMLLHARAVLGGTAGMAQVDLDVRRNSHQTLSDLAPMAYAVLSVVVDRLQAEGRLAKEPIPPFQAADGRLVEVEMLERPPLAGLRAPA
jgi:glucosyl-3-phosphoglycerate synthase